MLKNTKIIYFYYFCYIVTFFKIIYSIPFGSPCKGFFKMNIFNNQENIESIESNVENKKINKRINKIVFNTEFHGIPNHIVVEKNKLDKWRQVSEFIDVLMASYHNDETLQLYLKDIVHISCECAFRDRLLC